MKKVEIRILGGAKEVGRSCIYLETDQSSILLDCGIKQGETTEYPELEEIGPIDSVILSHAHIDHTGALPLLSNKGLLQEEAPIYCTPPTATITKTLLWDSLKLHKQKWDEEGVEYLFQKTDVEDVLERMVTVPYHSFQVTSDIKGRFGNSGHILGSSWIRIESGGKSLLYTGDLGEGRSNHLARPEDPPKSDVLITESTYGSTRQHPSFTDVCNELISLASKETPILIPSFAVGRSQEILRLLKTRKGIKGSRIFYDGMITDLMPTFRGYTSDIYMAKSIVNSIKNAGDPCPFHPEGASIPRTMSDRRRIARSAKHPIIVAPSGMLEGGWSTFYLKEFSRFREKAEVILVGYQAEGTVGRKLSECEGEESSVTLNALAPPGEAVDEADSFGFHDVEAKVPCSWIRSLSGFSTHASSNFILKFLRKTLPERILILHGDEKNSKALKEVIESDSTLKNSEIDIPNFGEKLRIKERIPESFKRRLDDLENKIERLEGGMNENKGKRGSE